MARRINQLGLDKIKQWEGLRLSAYHDSVGVLTIGYGHTSAAGSPKVTPNLTITQQEAENILRADLLGAESDVNRLVKVEITDNQFAALVSFRFNVGPGAFRSSTLLRKLNAGDYDAVPSELMKWTKGTVKGKKVTIKGLVNRRSVEAALWATGDFVSSNHVKPSEDKPRAPTRDVAAAGASGAAGAGVAVAPAVPAIVNAVTDQQSELSSGDWVRMSIAGVILALTIFVIVRKFRK